MWRDERLEQLTALSESAAGFITVLGTSRTSSGSLTSSQHLQNLNLLLLFVDVFIKMPISSCVKAADANHTVRKAKTSQQNIHI